MWVKKMPSEVIQYACDECNTFYDEMESAYECEESHPTLNDLDITGILEVGQYDFPDSIEVTSPKRPEFRAVYDLVRQERGGTIS